MTPERERLRHSFTDPLHEASYVTLMRLHALNDDRAGALDFAEKNNERWFESETHRTVGDLMTAQGATSTSESAYCKAIDVARSQGARSLELRAAISLARL